MPIHRSPLGWLAGPALCAGLLVQGAPPELALSPCPVPGTSLAARCGTLTVPEHRGSPNGRTIGLRVMLIPATGDSPAPDPIVPLPGGPGDRVIANARNWAFVLAAARTQRAILLVDPRGTGGSGALDCDLDNPQGHLAGYFRDFLPPDRVNKCHAELAQRVDLAAYGTESIAADLEAVRTALGFPTLNLYGVSGGTRQAQVYLARYPSRVRSVILGGVVAREFRMPLDYARDAQAALDSLAAACRADSLCQRAYPRFSADFDSLLRRLAERAARVAVPRPDGITDTVTVTRDIFAERVRTWLYSPERAAALPSIVAQALAGDYLPFVETVVPGRVIQEPGGISMGHFLALTCTEDVPLIRESEIAAASAGTFLGDYRIRQQRRGCEGWPRAPVPKDHFTPASRAVPTLMISGDADPVTPPRWADTARRYLPNSLSLVWRGAGHVPIATPCAMKLAAEFIAAASVRGLETGCVAEFRRPAFVIR
jgi:pimeloyl-ACP methyl ester carboxylesterase